MYCKFASVSGILHSAALTPPRFHQLTSSWWYYQYFGSNFLALSLQFSRESSTLYFCYASIFLSFLIFDFSYQFHLGGPQFNPLRTMDKGIRENGVCTSESDDGRCDVWSSKTSDSSSADHLVVMVNGILGRSDFFVFFLSLISAVRV